MGKMYCEDLVARLYSSYSPWPQRAQVLTAQSHQSAGLGESAGKGTTQLKNS